jgi:hypothetical protein
VPAVVSGPDDEAAIEAELAKVTVRITRHLEEQARAALYY